MQLTIPMSGLCDLQIFLCSFMSRLQFLTNAETGGSISAVSSDPQSAGSVHNQRLVIELDSPLMFTLVSHQRSRRAEEK